MHWTLISLMDVKSNRLLARTIGKLATAINTVFDADFRWQDLLAVEWPA